MIIGNDPKGKKEILEKLQIITGTSPNTGGTTNTSTSIELDSNASSTDGAYDPAEVRIIAGTGVGQARQILEYNGTTKVAYIKRDWKVIPDDTSEYCICYHSGDTSVNEGLAQAGSNNTITLNTLASASNNVYLGQCVYLLSGTGADQTRMIVGYNGTTKVATVDSAWIVNPDSTSIYAIMPFPGFVHGAATADGSANTLMRDVIGNKNDNSLSGPGSDSLYGIAAFMSYYHVHSPSKCFPRDADPVTLTAVTGAGTWS